MSVITARMVERSAIERAARILGPSSAAARALADADARTEPVVFVAEAGYIFVVPRGDDTALTEPVSDGKPSLIRKDTEEK